jgi:hypothetical protein
VNRFNCTPPVAQPSGPAAVFENNESLMPEASDAPVAIPITERNALLAADSFSTAVSTYSTLTSSASALALAAISAFNSLNSFKALNALILSSLTLLAHAIFSSASLNRSSKTAIRRR